MKKLFILFLFIVIFAISNLSARVFNINESKAYTNIALSVTLNLANDHYNREYVSVLTENDIINSFRSDIPFFDRWAINKTNRRLNEAGYYLTVISLGSTILFNSWDYPYTWDNLLVLGEIIVVQNSLRGWTKSLTLRKRPYVYDEDTGLETKIDKDARFSFYSNHTSIAFALAVYTHYYQLNTLKDPFIIASSYALATLVAISRIVAGQHFPSDVITGTIVGSLSSYLICRSHRSRRKTNIYFGANSLQIKTYF